MARHKVEICGVNTANIKVLTNEETKALFQKMKEGDSFAREDLISGNLKLVLSILNNVPAVPIAYGQKTFSLAEMCNLSKYALVWNTYQSEYYGKSIDVSVEQIMEKVNQLCGDIDNVKIEMQSYKDELINSASNAFLQLMTVLYH